MTLHDLDSYLRTHRRHGKQKARPPSPPASSPPPNGAGKELSRARAFGRGLHAAGFRALAFELGKPQDFELARPIVTLRQPESKGCWATAFTLLESWRRQEPLTIERALERLGQTWVDLFHKNTGTTAEDELTLFAAAGLVAEPTTGFTLETWETKLRIYGPLWVVLDVDPSDQRSIHAVVLTGIHGDGTPAGTRVSVIDPWTGTRAPWAFADFIAQYEQGAARRVSSGRGSGFVHYPKDASYAHAKETTPFNKGPTTPTSSTPGPWSTYFPFRKGSTYEVDGPLSYNGAGEVQERTSDTLKFTLVMGAALGVPAADMQLEIVYKKEGKGNIARATINGVLMEDNDAEITSSGSKRRIVPKFTGFSGPLPEWLTMQPDGSNQIELTVRIDGGTHDFDLNLKKGSSGLALGIEPWSRYFNFAAGTKFRVDGPASFDGGGQVLERTDTFLKFELNMPAGRVLVVDIPKLDLIVAATYSKEGPGNTVELTFNGVKYTDSNASITSSGNRRTITPSIKVPSLNLQTVACGPDGPDEIDLDVTIDGQTHDFDLERLVPASKAQNRKATPLASSSAADGVKEVSAFAARKGTTRWKLDRADVAKRLEELVRDPDLVDQGDLNMCGPVAFFHLWARRDPAAFARYGADLFEKGEASIGTLKVKPSDKLVLNDYAKIRKRMTTLVTRSAEWMVLSALRNSEGRPMLEGDPNEALVDTTLPGEIASWLQATGAYTKVTDDTGLKNAAHALKLQPNANRDILLLIKAAMIEKGQSSILPDHYIQLLTPLKSDGKTVEFDCWTWGGKRHVSISVTDFESNYFGALSAEL